MSVSEQNTYFLCLVFPRALLLRGYSNSRTIKEIALKIKHIKN